MGHAKATLSGDTIEDLWLYLGWMEEAYVSDYVSKGIEKSRLEAMQRAADMETALTIALAKKFKKPDELILSKLEKWQGKSALNWTATIESLRKAQEK